MSRLRPLVTRLRRWLRDSAPYLVVASLLCLFVVAYLFHRIFITVPAGHGGVHYRWFAGGTDIDNVYGEGLHLVWPWNSMTIYDMRIQEVDRDVDVLTADGLAVQLKLSVRFRPTHRLLAMLHREHGPDYVQSFLLAELESAARREIGLVTPAQLYSSARDSVEAAIDRRLLWELREIEHFLDTRWPRPPGYYQWRAAAESRYDTDSAAFDSLQRVALDSLNVRLVLAHMPDGELRRAIAISGPLQHYHQLSTRSDSLHFMREAVEAQIRGIESALTHDHAEMESGVHDLQVEAHETPLVARYDALLKQRGRLGEQLLELRHSLDEIVDAFDENFMPIAVHDVLIKSIVLPAQIARAIQNKLEQEQIAEEFTHRLVREHREAERKRIEAMGIRDFQETVVRGITPSLLRWKGIEATLELAKSNNTKVVVIGASDDGLPLILNTDDGSGVQATPRAGPILRP